MELSNTISKFSDKSAQGLEILKDSLEIMVYVYRQSHLISHINSGKI